jgi:glycine reductase
MAEPVRVVHYLNQFFGGIGGEEAASAPVEVRAGAVGPGRPLQQALGDQAVVVATIICGDNYFAEAREAALAKLTAALREGKPDVLVAGPAFQAGRYGLACAEACQAAQAIGLPALAAMHPDNPGAGAARRGIYIVPAGATPVEMPAALAALARVALKLGRGEALGPAEVEGYLPRGIRKQGLRDAPGYRRAVDMLVAKLSGRPFTTEVPYLAPERVAPARPIVSLREAPVALVTTGGIVPKGNPDRQASKNASRYYRYSIAHLQSMSSDQWEAYHAGYFTHLVNHNPNYVLPLNYMRELEAAGEIGSVYPGIFTLPGVSTPVPQAEALGRGIAQELRDGGVLACLLVAT